MAVSEETNNPYDTVLPEMLLHSFHEGEAVSMKSEDEDFALSHLVFLDEYITVMVIELTMNAMDEYGIMLQIDPSTRDKLNELYIHHGMCHEKMLEIIDDAVHAWNEEAKKKAGRSDISQTYVINEFMKASAFYTSTSDIFMKVYKFLRIHMNDIVDYSVNVDEFESEYSDIINVAEINDIVHMYDKPVTQYPIDILELITFLIKKGKHTKMTYGEFEEALKNVNPK